MTNNDLVEHLERADVESVSPKASELRAVSKAHRGRRNRVAVVVGAMGILVTAGATVLLPLPGSTAPTRVDATGDDTPTTAADPGPAESQAEPWSILVPRDGWELTGFSSSGWTHPFDQPLIETPAGTAGPLARVVYNPDVDTLDYEDGPINYRDVTSTAGRTVRIGFDHNPSLLTAITMVDKGSIAVTAVGVSEPDLLAIVDAEGDLSVSDAELPDPYRIVDPGFGAIGPRIAINYTLRQDRTEVLVSSIDRASNEYDAVLGFHQRPGVREEMINEQRVLIAWPERLEAVWPAALVITDDRIIEIESVPVTPDATPLSIDELRAVIDNLNPIGESEVRAALPQLDLRDRASMLDAQIAQVTSAGLPPGVSLDWFRNGPPLTTEEATVVNGLIHCAWVTHWAEVEDSADGGVIDEVESVIEETTASLLDRPFYDVTTPAPDGERPRSLDEISESYERMLDEMRSATSRDERLASDLFQTCRSHQPGLVFTG